jgi:hypothetical protein
MSARALPRRLLPVILLCAAQLLPRPAAADELKPFAATYSIAWRGMSAGAAELELERLPDGRWSYQSRTSRRGLGKVIRLAELSMTQRSVFRFQYGKVIPESFTVDDGSANDSRDQDLTFDWVAGRVQGIAERKPVELPIQPGVLDELSVHVALMQALSDGRTPEGFAMIDGDHVKDYLYSAEGEERLKTAVGEYDTVIFRSSRPNSRKGTWFWCAPELGYLPLKIESRDGKDVTVSMRLEKLQR